MQDLIDGSILSILHRNIRKAIDDMVDHVASGGCQDFPEYRKSTGFIEGLSFAERELIDLVERAQKED